MKEKETSLVRALETIIENMGIDVYVTDFETYEILYANSSMAAPYGGVEKMIGKTCWKFLYNDKVAPCEYCPRSKVVDENGDVLPVYCWDYERPFDGSWFRVFSKAIHWSDGRLAQLTSSVDITDQKETEKLIKSLAIRDVLTNLYNRTELTRYAEKRLSELMLSEESDAYLIFFDLNGFKKINDTYGHPVGDELLIQLAARLQSNPLIKEQCYRYGGDEFVVFCDGERAEQLLEILAFLQKIFSAPFSLKSINKEDIICNASIGISHFPADGVSLTSLLRKADHAMYHSKENGKKDIYFYNQNKYCTADEYFFLEPEQTL